MITLVANTLLLFAEMSSIQQVGYSILMIHRLLPTKVRVDRRFRHKILDIDEGCLSFGGDHQIFLSHGHCTTLITNVPPNYLSRMTEDILFPCRIIV